MHLDLEYLSCIMEEYVGSDEDPQSTMKDCHISF